MHALRLDPQHRQRAPIHLRQHRAIPSRPHVERLPPPPKHPRRRQRILCRPQRPRIRQPHRPVRPPQQIGHPRPHEPHPHATQHHRHIPPGTRASTAPKCRSTPSIACPIL